MTDRTVRFTVVAVIVGLLAALLILVFTIGRNGIRIETVGEVRIVGMPSEIALRMADPVNLTMPEGTTLVGEEGIPVSVTAFPCPTCGSPLVPTRLNLFTGRIEWTCPVCDAAETP
ncbi:MAG: hypothetical protein AB7V19_05180 [Candidatus Bipolaricaulia bacterium]